ncbi:hypothetical protein C7B65_27175 [Phormidesmis priestleyi ULC007]|uniref:Uncharacterized protein n=1 Tax=Phormidesmis priestleyi ULC007 TaxID=1920490 RepID=A0A2T1CXU0_9CYAN|nr:hypothetical protein C7B65_27175 [Phormidesmis priestleyi ULC007]
MYFFAGMVPFSGRGTVGLHYPSFLHWLSTSIVLILLGSILITSGEQTVLKWEKRTTYVYSDLAPFLIS